jgi:anti-anti-sigma factor
MAVQEVRGLLKNLLDTTDAKAVVLNLATVHDFGADGLGMLVRFHGQSRAKGIAFTLSNLTPTLREHIRLDGLDRLFVIVDDEAEALATFAKIDQEDAPA